MISRKKAWAHFYEVALPRRIKDHDQSKSQDGNQHRYRRVGPEEDDRGEPYPLCHDGINTFGHFGIGIGIYFAQLVILSTVCFICGFIMVTGGEAYNREDYGISYPTVPLSAACNIVNVTATKNCPNGATECIAFLRPQCDLPYPAAAADLAMCFLLAFTILISKIVESRIEVKLDESIQTVQDYSIEVLDPNHDADDPDEWYKFFSQFGKVAYITIVRRNGALTDILLKKHRYAMKLKESGVFGSSIALKREQYIAKYHDINRELAAALQTRYPVCRVFVTFEEEAGQRKCVEELEVPDLQATMDSKYKDNVLPEHRFRGENILNVREPPEPDNIIWKNLEVDSNLTWAMKLLSMILSVGLFVIFWYIVVVSSSNYILLAIIIGIIDSCLPYIMAYVTDLLVPLSEGTRQSSLQMRLFFARLLVSTLIPYIQSDWTEVLDDEFLTQVFIVQVSACFTAPIFAFFDVQGLFNRHVLAYFAETQVELNTYFNGTEWSLAEKYTGIARVLFVSLFYSLLTPLSVLLCAVAFVVVFLIDNYLLLRKWKPPNRLDAKIAVRLRQQAVLAVAAHMYVTLRFIYSWPMDDVRQLSDGSYEFVDKNPPLSPFRMDREVWHSQSQRDIFNAYRTCWVVMALIALYMWIIEPAYKFLHRMLCYNLKSAGNCNHPPFSMLPGMSIYYPMLVRDDRKYLCSFTKGVLYRHRPQVHEALSMEKDDLSSYVPIVDQPRVLSVIKFYGMDPMSYVRADQEAAMQMIPHKTAQAPTASPDDVAMQSKTVLQRLSDYIYGIYYDNLFVPIAYHLERQERRRKLASVVEDDDGPGKAMDNELIPLGRGPGHNNIIHTTTSRLMINSDLSEHYARQEGEDDVEGGGEGAAAAGANIRIHTHLADRDGLDEHVPLIVRTKPVGVQASSLGRVMPSGRDSPDPAAKLSQSSSAGLLPGALSVTSIVENIRANRVSPPPGQVRVKSESGEMSPSPSVRDYQMSHSDHIVKTSKPPANTAMEVLTPVPSASTPHHTSHVRDPLLPAKSEHVVKIGGQGKLPKLQMGHVHVHANDDPQHPHINTTLPIEQVAPTSPLPTAQDKDAMVYSEHIVKVRSPSFLAGEPGAPRETTVLDPDLPSLSGHIMKRNSLVHVGSLPPEDKEEKEEEEERTPREGPQRRQSVYAASLHIDTTAVHEALGEGMESLSPTGQPDKGAESFDAHSDHYIKKRK